MRSDGQNFGIKQHRGSAAAFSLNVKRLLDIVTGDRAVKLIRRDSCFSTVFLSRFQYRARCSRFTRVNVGLSNSLLPFDSIFPANNDSSQQRNIVLQIIALPHGHSMFFLSRFPS